MIVRILMCYGRDKKCTEEFVGHTLSKGDTRQFCPSFKARTVCRMRIHGDGKGGDASDGNKVEGIDHVFPRKDGLLLWSHRMRGGSVHELNERIMRGIAAHHGRSVRLRLRVLAGSVHGRKDCLVIQS